MIALLVVILAVTAALPFRHSALNLHLVAICKTNLKGVWVGLTMYAETHDGALPPTHRELVAEGLLGERAFLCPTAERTEGVDPLFVYAWPDTEEELKADAIVAADKAPLHDKSRNVLYGGGRVAHLKEDDFRFALLAPENDAIREAIADGGSLGPMPDLPPRLRDHAPPGPTVWLLLLVLALLVAMLVQPAFVWADAPRPWRSSALAGLATAGAAGVIAWACWDWAMLSARPAYGLLYAAAWLLLVTAGLRPAMRAARQTGYQRNILWALAFHVLVGLVVGTDILLALTRTR